MAGAGVGVAIAGASSSGNADQYTPGAKPYNGVQPHNVTVGTQTFPSSVTTTIANTTVTKVEVVTSPYSSTTVTLVGLLEQAVNALNAEQTATVSLSAQLSAVLKGDLRNLLEPTGSYLKVATLAKAKSVSFKFTSPGSGKLAVKWLVGAPGKKGVDYVNYSGSFKKSGAIVVKLPSTAAGRSALTGAKSANVVAAVTYTGTSGNSIKVSRSYKLAG